MSKEIKRDLLPNCKIHEEYRGLSRSEIEKIVRQTIEEIQRKERKELADTVRGTD